MDSRGKRISIPSDKDTGKLDLSALEGKLGVVQFRNPQALTPLSANRYGANALSGEATMANTESYRIVSGYLEQSAVSLADEMANMILAQRAYGLSARVVQVADETEQLVSNLRK